MGWLLAIDFGTSSTAAAVVDDGGAAKPLMMPDASATLSSAVFAQGDKLLVGAKADNAAELDLKAYEPTPKGRVGQSHFKLGKFEPAQLIGAVLGDVLSEAVRQHNWVAPDRVVLTYPVFWQKPRRQVLEAAFAAAAAEAGLAGVGDPVLVPEPVAAAHWFARRYPSKPGDCFAVYDLGGGTFDSAVLRATAEGYEVVGEPGGIESLGGWAFDNLLLTYLGERFIAPVNPELWAQLNPLAPPPDDAEMAGIRRRLQLRVRELKERLTTETSVNSPLPGVPEPKLVNRGDDYEPLIVDLIDETITELERTIADAGLTPQDLTAIYCIGGAARTPLVSHALDRLHRHVRTDDHPKLVVALGAATNPPRPKPSLAPKSPEPQPSLVPNTPTVAAVIQPGYKQIRGVTVDPLSHTVYVIGDRSVLMIDPVSRTVTATVRHFLERKIPRVLAVDARAHTVYATTFTPDGGSSRKVSVIDFAARKVVASIRVRWPADAVAVDADTHLVYVTHGRAQSGYVDKVSMVSVIDPETRAVTATIPVGRAPGGLAVDPSSHTVYVANVLDNTLSVIDAKTHTVTATIHVGRYPLGVAVDPGSHTVYVTNHRDDTVSVIDANTRAVTATIPVGEGPWEVAVDLGGPTVWVINRRDDTVSVIDANARTVTATIPCYQPGGVAVDPDSHTVYIASAGFVSMYEPAG
jgi:YVTN family beta-propeller protein